jgi:hypothetical protein
VALKEEQCPGKGNKSQRKIFTFRRRTMSVEAAEVLDNSLLTWISGEDLELIMRREHYLAENGAGEALPMLEVRVKLYDGESQTPCDLHMVVPPPPPPQKCPDVSQTIVV